LGDALIGADPSNQDGHFEDIETVRLHNQWLLENKTDWCSTDELPEVDAGRATEAIGNIARRMNQHTHAAMPGWGIKDPRAALFLDHWFNALENPYGVFVYRHFASCLSSLLRRQADELFKNPTTEYNDIRFWHDPNIALRSWLLHNRALLSHIKRFPDRCILLSQEAQLAGTSLAGIVASSFPIELDGDAETGVDTGKTMSVTSIAIEDSSLKNELQDIWSELQSVSSAAAPTEPRVDWSISTTSETSMSSIEKLWDDLGIPKSSKHAA